MHGERSILMDSGTTICASDWINEIKIAMISEDLNRAAELASTPPTMSDLETMEEAKALIAELIKTLEAKKEITRLNIANIKAAKNFLT